MKKLVTATCSSSSSSSSSTYYYYHNYYYLSSHNCPPLGLGTHFHTDSTNKKTNLPSFDLKHSFLTYCNPPDKCSCKHPKQ